MNHSFPLNFYRAIYIFSCRSATGKLSVLRFVLALVESVSTKREGVEATTLGRRAALDPRPGFRVATELKRAVSELRFRESKAKERTEMKILTMLLAAVVLGFGMTANGKPAPPQASEDGAATARAMVATIADVSWLAGRWTGVVGTGTTEEICSAPADGVMMCMFRAMNGGKTQGMEFITLREISPGIEERARFFSSDLTEDPGDNGVALKMVSLSPMKIVFDNARENGPVKHITITRAGEDGFATHIELVGPAGKSSFIDSEWKRTK
jgi:hypothetical protein